MKNKKIQIVFEAGPTHNGFKSAKKLILVQQFQEQMQLNFKLLMLMK